ncbi:hypothetical protein [Hymenobacter terrestris]|uniref:Uncharacterized protein n=1 Tax=Hymenobacter terrestris TaxID=2748310 RepID=A0ABX2QA20_9BACT|nr:hypothetical protein [Hymenobacter terrestris]NVO86592.1 hypothetical protein [Hymenobacter terrestris]
MEIAALLQAARPAMLGLILVLAACNDDKPAKPVELKVHSVTPNLVRVLPGFEPLQILPLIWSDDVLSESPAFVFGLQPNGAGMLRVSGPGTAPLQTRLVLTR